MLNEYLVFIFLMFQFILIYCKKNNLIIGDSKQYSYNLHNSSLNSFYLHNLYYLHNSYAKVIFGAYKYFRLYVIKHNIL